jgi:hypothetical protein
MEHNEAVSNLQKWLGEDADVLTSGSGKVYVGMWMELGVDFRCVADGDSVESAVAGACASWEEYKEQVQKSLPDDVEMDEGIVADQYQMDADADEAADAVKLFSDSGFRDKP